MKTRDEIAKVVDSVIERAVAGFTPDTPFPMRFHLVAADGKVTTCVPADCSGLPGHLYKQIVANLVMDMVKAMGSVVAVVSEMESWSLVTTEYKSPEEYAAAGGLPPSQHPDRVETLVFMVEESGACRTEMREILRGPDGKYAGLGSPRVYQGESDGRFANLLHAL